MPVTYVFPLDVIDTGKVKMKRHEAARSITHFGAQWVSKASAVQRAGRAGRVSEGECYRLYTQARFESFNPFQVSY